MTRLSTFAEQRMRPSPLGITLLACVAALLPADAKAQLQIYLMHTGGFHWT